MADEKPVSADRDANDLTEGVLVPDVVDPGVNAPAEAMIVPDLVEPETGPSVDREGDGSGLLDVIGPSGGSGETFELLTEVDGSIVVRLMGEVDLSTVPELEAAVGRVLSAGCVRLVVDARELEFADSSAIALWVRWANQAGRVEIRDPSPMLRGRISGMGLADRFTLTP